jgi:hypothetical protein
LVCSFAYRWVRLADSYLLWELKMVMQPALAVHQLVASGGRVKA